MIGAILLLLAITIRHSAWAYVGFIPLVTGTVGYCPIYALFGISTYQGRDRLSTRVLEL